MSTFEFQFKTERQLNNREIDNLVHGVRGEVGRKLHSRGRLIVAAAKRQVGKDTRALQLSIKMIHSRDSLGQFLWIGSKDKKALMHHEGTKPHIILPRNAKMLRFSSGGRVIYSRMVRHPGTKPNRYLSDNLVLVRV